MSALIDIPFPEDCNHCLICSLIPELPKRELREKGLQYRLYCKATGECVSGVGRGEDCPLHECKMSDVPSAQPEIIRCKNCKHRDAENGFCEGRGWPMQLVPDDGFCDKGERNEE